jgi:hypothetical protein
MRGQSLRGFSLSFAEGVVKSTCSVRGGYRLNELQVKAHARGDA